MSSIRTLRNKIFRRETAPVAKMKNRMQLLINEGLSLSNKLPRKELQSNLQTVVSFMLEDL